ncbi:uncharacterized protein [Phyllobates terribilis]|uniref:uncharacterized protein isoform X1 n=1 Tax=Phyllobates terribilis TaxID=111132 RepID=UPI003CCB01C8
MLITVYCVRRDLSEITFSLDVDQDFELENFRALCELESGIPAAECLIIYAEQPLTDNQRSLSSYGLKDGDVVVLRQKDAAESRSTAPRPAAAFPGLPRIDFSSIAVPGTSRPPAASPQHRPPAPDSTSFPQGLDNPALLREMLLANPHELSLLKERNPPLAEALLSQDLEKFTKVLVEQQQERARREQERIRLFSADPFDLDAQAKIEEDIRQQNIEENMTIAMEEAPESFGQVVMLYINCKVNGYPVKAFVDSGAQMTIMSQACAERCHIMRLVDRRWAGIAKGVGTQKIIGRVHLAQVQIEGDFLPCSFSILEEQPMDMLLGLDMLKRHQCSIDLEKNVLIIGTTGTRTSFLPEGELPECARLAYGPGTEDIRPEDIADRELAEVLQKSAEEADKESTSEAGPLLVPPLDGSGHPAHASDTIPPASPVPTPSGATDVPCADVTCSGDFHPGGSGHTGDMSDAFRSAVTDDLPGAESSDSPSSAADRGLGPTLTSAADRGLGLTLTSAADRGLGPTLTSAADRGLGPTLTSAADRGLGPTLTSAADRGLGPTLTSAADRGLGPTLTSAADRGLGPTLTSAADRGLGPTLTSAADRGLGPTLTSAADRGLGPTLTSDAGSAAYEESERRPHPMAALPPSTSSPVEGGEVTPAPCAITEDMMELDTQVIPDLDGCRSEGILTIQGPECQNLSCTNLPPNPERSEDACSVTAQDCPKPVAASGQDGEDGGHDGEDGCFSLASALKELHKLVVLSGQRAGGEDGAHRSGADCSELNQDLHQESEQNGWSGRVAERNVADIPGDCSSDCMESVGRSAPDQPLPDAVLNHGAIAGAASISGDSAAGYERHPGLSADPEGVVCERSPSMHPIDPPSAVEHIVAAGFTRQDALVALERADGDVELALLALLAKNIVVPT